MAKKKIVEIKVPEKVEVEISGNHILVRGPKGEVSRTFQKFGMEILKKDHSITIDLKDKKLNKKNKMLFMTTRAHIRNLIKGALEGFEYKLKVCSIHFPITVTAEKGQVIIKNFLGEKIPRKADIINGTNVKVDGDIIIVSGVDKERVGQMAARVEQTTRITNKDRRVFGDGAWIFEKGGKKL